MEKAELQTDPHDDSPDRVALLCFSAQPSHMKLARSLVRDASAMCGCSATVVQDLVLAIDEACQNIIRHAYAGVEGGKVELEILCKDDELEFRLQDFAPTVDKEKIKPNRPKELRPGGLGVFLMHEVMDSVDYLPVPPGKGNLLRLVKRIEREAK